MLSSDVLKLLELDSVAVTATVDADGRLGRIGGLWEKLGKQTTDLAHRRLLHTVMVADDQEDVPKEYLRFDAEPLRVIKAKSVADAVLKLNEQSLPRRAVRRYEFSSCKDLDILDRRAPIKKHYQVLPLLREVKREHLPRDPLAPEMRADADGGLRRVDILRWEEELQQRHVTYKSHPLEKVFSEFRQVVDEAKSDAPRFVVLGPPGSGKSTLLQYLAWLNLFGACLRGAWFVAQIVW